MRKHLKILLWYLLSLGFVFLLALSIIGSPTVLKHSAKVKPYAVVFQTENEIRRASLASEDVVLFLGDSSVAQPPWAGKHTPHTPALLESELLESHAAAGKVSVIEWAFAGARPFHYYCLLFEAEKYSPALLIIPINWRCLGSRSAEWNEQFAFPELSACVPLGERGRPWGKSILQLEGISPSRQLFYSSHYPMLYLSGLKMWGRTKLGMEPHEDPLSNLLEGLPSAEEFIGRFSDERLFAQYAVEIGADNTQLRGLRSLVEASARRGIKLLFYITPIHIDEMRRRRSFDPVKFGASVGRVVESAASETSVCLNLVALLGEEHFIDYFEHYTPEGNRKIARSLAPAVRQLIDSSGPAAVEPIPLALRSPVR